MIDNLVTEVLQPQASTMFFNLLLTEVNERKLHVYIIFGWQITVATLISVKRVQKCIKYRLGQYAYIHVAEAD